jgi:hypothetical protein
MAQDEMYPLDTQNLQAFQVAGKKRLLPKWQKPFMWKILPVQTRAVTGK